MILGRFGVPQGTPKNLKKPRLRKSKGPPDPPKGPKGSPWPYAMASEGPQKAPGANFGTILDDFWNKIQTILGLCFD